jgi:hypothetical protein
VLCSDPSSRWIIVQLHESTSLAEHYEQIGHTIGEVLGPDTQYFIPIYHERVQGKNVSFVLCEGYIFVLRTESTIQNIFRLKSEHIRGPLFFNGSLRLVTGQRINRLRQDMQDRIRALIPEKGQRVIPKVGVFKNLEGEVLSVDQKKLVAIVRFTQPSRIVDAPINVVNLVILSSSIK